jgi:hypothetical protein
MLCQRERHSPRRCRSRDPRLPASTPRCRSRGRAGTGATVALSVPLNEYVERVRKSAAAPGDSPRAAATARASTYASDAEGRPPPGGYAARGSPPSSHSAPVVRPAAIGRLLCDECSPALARHNPRDTGRIHQPLDALTPDADVVLEPQLGVDPSRAVGSVRGRVDRLNLLGQPRVRHRPDRRRATLPVMKAGAVHAQRPTHQGDRIVRLFRLDQREDLAYGSPVSRAKKAAAFLRISRSIRSV